VTSTETARSPSVVFGGNLKRIREIRGLTQVQLSERLEQLGAPLHHTAIARTEKAGRKGGRAPSLDEVFALAVVLNVSPTALLLPAGGGTSDLRIGNRQISAEWADLWLRGGEPLDEESRFDFISHLVTWGNQSANDRRRLEADRDFAFRRIAEADRRLVELDQEEAAAQALASLDRRAWPTEPAWLRRRVEEIAQERERSK